MNRKKINNDPLQQIQNARGQCTTMYNFDRWLRTPFYYIRVTVYYAVGGFSLNSL